MIYSVIREDWHDRLIENVEDAGRYITENAANLVGEKTHVFDMRIIAEVKDDYVVSVKVERTHPVFKAVAR